MTDKAMDSAPHDRWIIVYGMDGNLRFTKINADGSREQYPFITYTMPSEQLYETWRYIDFHEAEYLETVCGKSNKKGGWRPVTEAPRGKWLNVWDFKNDAGMPRCLMLAGGDRWIEYGTKTGFHLDPNVAWTYLTDGRPFIRHPSEGRTEGKPWVPAKEHMLREHIRRVVGIHLAKQRRSDADVEEWLTNEIMAIREDLKVTFNREMR